MSVTFDTERSCTGALELRAWMLPLLGGGVGEEATGVAPPRGVVAGAWSVFLARERCTSLLVGSELGRSSPQGQGTALLAGVPAAVRTRALEEARRTLAARALLHRMDAILGSAGIGAVVLKGGAAVARGRTIDLADVDILVGPGHARDVAALLERAMALTPDGPDPLVGGHGMTHLAPRKGEEGLPVEVHFSLRHMPDPAELLARSVPLEGLSHVRGLDPADHLHHLVVHNALQHPERRGILRDVGLALQAARVCQPVDVEEVRSRLRTDRVTGPAGALLTVVTTLAEGRTPTDPFRRSAAVGYLLAAEGRRRDRRATSRRAAAATSLLAGSTELARLLRSSADPWELESTFTWVATLEGRWPRLGRGVRIVGGVTRTLLDIVSAVGLAWRARRLTDGSAPPLRGRDPAAGDG